MFARAPLTLSPAARACRSFDDFVAAHGHPSKRRDILNAGELEALFASHGWDVALSETQVLADTRPLACVLARRP